MSAGNGIYRDEMEVSYAVDFGRDREPTQKRSRHPEYRRKGSAPARVSGMHCRRNKRWTWGSGRGARMLNLRSFAGAVLAAMCALSVGSVARGDTVTLFGMDFNSVAGGTSAPAGNGYGQVTTNFLMGKTEVTVAKYAEFLNATGAPNGTFKGAQPITLVSGTYTANAGFANRPITNVNWFDAARFANWLQNGGTAGASTETGAYTLNNTTTTVVARNPNAVFFVPNANEWTKAAFYNPTTPAWMTYATNNNTLPTATTPNSSNANSANFAGAVGSTSNVGSYTLATSAYGIYDMVGNVAEFTDTASGNSVIRLGGNWNQLGIPTSSTTLTFGAATLFNGNLGFRVAAVPEPGTIALAGMGIAGLAGLDWMKRRKKRLAARQDA